MSMAIPQEALRELREGLASIQSQCAGHADEFSQQVWNIAERAMALSVAAIAGAPPQQHDDADFIARRGYQRCDIPACNCGSYHGGHAEARLDEIREALESAGVDLNGRTLLKAVQALAGATTVAPPGKPKRDPDWQVLDYERLVEAALLKSIQLYDGERLLVLRPFGWHIDGSHIPNAAEHFSREGVCREHRWEVVCDYGPYIAVVRPAPPAGDAAEAR